MKSLLNQYHGRAGTYALMALYFLSLAIPQLQNLHPDWRVLPELGIAVGAAWRAVGYFGMASAVASEKESS